MDIPGNSDVIWLLIIETFILMSIALAFLVWRNRRLRHQLAGTEADKPADARQMLLQGLQQELEQTRNKAEQAGTNSPEAQHLHEACEFRIRVLEGELAVCAAGDEEPLYWQQIVDYFDGINQAFNARLAELQFRLRTYLERIDNLEGFKAQVFALTEKLRLSRETIQQLETELEKHLPAESRSAELESALQNMREEKQHLEDQISRVEQEYETLMKNIEFLEQRGDTDTAGSLQDSPQDILSELQSCKEENEFLCNQVATLLKEELKYEDTIAEQQERLNKQIANSEKTITELEAKLAEMEKNYLALQEQSLKKQPR